MSQEKLKSVMINAVESIKADPESAKGVFAAQVEWIDGASCSAKAQSSSPLDFNKNPGARLGLGCRIDMQGKNADMVPGEMLLVAVGSCLAISYSTFAAVEDLKLDKVIVKLKGYVDFRGMLGFDKSYPVGFEKITYQTIIESPESEETLRDLVRRSEAHCPVLDSVASPVDVHGETTINDIKI
ncbi:MAG TPA: OsmC family peroxiredoxin [Nitrospirae bacterium]|nr:OsmC family peroxiredoxin [Nitrospirota bacterium]